MQKLMGTVSVRVFTACAAIGAGVLLGGGPASAQPLDAPRAPNTVAPVADPHTLVAQFIRVLNTGSSGLCLPFATGSNAGTPGCG